MFNITFYLFEFAVYLFEFALHIFEFGLSIFEFGLSIFLIWCLSFELGIQLFKLVFILLNLRLKRCRELDSVRLFAIRIAARVTATQRIPMF